MSSIDDRYYKSELTSKIIKGSFNVHNNLSSGFNEIIYQRALALEMEGLGLEFAREEWLDIHYRDKKIGKKRVDFLFRDCIVEIKAKKEFDPQDYMQLIAYLKATKYKVGLLINFGSQKVEYRRFVN